MPDGNEVTAEGLTKSLDDLIAVADATDALAKGDANGVEHSGHNDERGKVGGGRTSSTGGLDRMMIAKMAESGIDASTIANFEAFMVGKQTDDDEDDEEMDAEMKAKMKARMRGRMGADPAGTGYDKSAYDVDDLSKSSLEGYREDNDIADAIDVSPYLEAMTARTADQIDAVRSTLSKGLGDQAAVNQAMALATYEMGTLIKSQTKVIAALGQRLGLVETQPAPARGATSLQGAQAMQKSLAGEAGGGENQLSKSDLCRVLNYMKLEKGENTIAGQNTTEAVCMLEAGGSISQDVMDAAHRFVSQNPNEAQLAKSFH